MTLASGFEQALARRGVESRLSDAGHTNITRGHNALGTHHPAYGSCGLCNAWWINGADAFSNGMSLVRVSQR